MKLKKSSNLLNSVVVRRSVTIFILAISWGKGASYGAIVVCVCPIAGAPEQVTCLTLLDLSAAFDTIDDFIHLERLSLQNKIALI